MENIEMVRMITQAITESTEDVKSQLLEKIDDVRNEMNSRFEQVNTRFDKLDTDMEYLKSKNMEHDRDIFILKKRIL